MINYDLFIEKLYEKASEKFGKRRDQITQTEIAQFLDYDKNKIQRWTKKTSLTVEDLILISEKFECSIDELLGTNKYQQKDTQELTYRELAKIILQLEKALGYYALTAETKYEHNESGLYCSDIALHFSQYPSRIHIEPFNKLGTFINSLNKINLALSDSELDDSKLIEQYAVISNALLESVPDIKLPYEYKSYFTEIFMLLSCKIQRR